MGHARSRGTLMGLATCSRWRGRGFSARRSVMDNAVVSFYLCVVNGGAVVSLRKGFLHPDGRVLRVYPRV